MGWLVRDIGIDLGTVNTLICVGDKIVVDEPSVVAIDRYTKEVLAVGRKAASMVGRTPENIVAVRPLRDGVIADFKLTQAMLGNLVDRVVRRRRFWRPRMVVGVPSGATTVERRAVVEAARNAGAREVFLIEEPLAAAIGAGLSIHAPEGAMVVDIGGGTSDAVVVALGGIVAGKSVRLGGTTMDDAITSYVRYHRGVMLGEHTAERIKIEIGTAIAGAGGNKGKGDGHDTDGFVSFSSVGSSSIGSDGPRAAIDVHGRRLVSGLPTKLTITADEVATALADCVHGIVGLIKEVLEKTPPELAADLVHTGVYLTGGGSLLRGLDRVIARETGLPVRLAEEPLLSVVRGTAMSLRELQTLRRSSNGLLKGKAS